MSTEKKDFKLPEELDDLCGQLLCVDISDKDDPDEVERMLREVKPGGIFVAGMPGEKVQHYKEMADSYSKIPCIVAADVEYGPGSALKGELTLPHPMAWGACGDAESIERAGYLTARICRASGIDYTFSPMVDLNYNFNCPVINVRSISDSPDLVEKIGGAYLRGMRRGGLVAACKTFPGDGTDDRNQHFCTAVNKLSYPEWKETYGKVFASMFAQGCESVMVGHIALPSFDTYADEYGQMPAVLSRRIMVDLLRKEMGFDGCIVSDAMSMIGACSRFPVEKLSVEYVKSGGDFILFPEKNDLHRLKQAIGSGELSLARVREAAARVLELKRKAGLFEKKPRGDCEAEREELLALSDSIAEKSIKIVRDNAGALTKPLKAGAKVLLIYLFGESSRERDREHIFDTLEKSLMQRRISVDVMVNPKHTALEDVAQRYDAVVVCAKFLPSDFCCGSSLRMGWENMLAFWRGYLLRHPKLVFVSFGDPYKLYEMPYLKTYVNAFSPSESTQRAVAAMLAGEMTCTARNPVGLEGFFNYGE